MDEPKETTMSDEYYDISVRACGFVNRLQTVKPKDGAAFLTCTFAALRGAKGERAAPTYFDVKVVGENARHLLENIKSVINDRAGRSLRASGSATSTSNPSHARRASSRARRALRSSRDC